MLLVFFRLKEHSNVVQDEKVLYYLTEDRGMEYTRTIEKLINRIKNEYAAITIYGARQVGKTTTADHVFGKEMAVVSLDVLENRTLANTNPKLFLEAYPWPVIIDEIQKAPPLIDEIKNVIDTQKMKCLKEDKQVPLMYVLTGSNQFELKKMVSDSLAGRTAILNMASLANNEIEKVDGDLFDPDINKLKEKYLKVKNQDLYRSRKQIFEKIFKGGMPEYITKNLDRNVFFSSYVATYIEKDVRKLINADKEADFLRFLEYMALRTAQQINYDDISRNIGVDVRTIKKWTSTLITSGIAFTLEPYAKNMSDRITKSSKFYFFDTGLCSYLCKWPTAEMIENGVMNGAFFETYVASEMVKSFINAGKDYKNYLYYYRDKDKKECDLIIDYVDRIYPIEIKKGINPVSSNFNFDYLKKYEKPVMDGLVIDSRENLFPINEHNWYCPVFMIGL